MKSATSPSRDELIERAKRVAPVFDGERLLATRELWGRSQADVATAANLTASALSQAERGVSTPTPSNLASLSDVLRVPVEAFARRPTSTTRLDPQFRHLRRTPKRERRKAVRLVEATASIVDVLETRVQLPPPLALTCSVDPNAPVERVADQVEDAATKTRRALGVTHDGPLDTECIVLLERNGIVVVRDPETDKAIDAYSAVVDGRPIVILDGGSQSVWDRDNFNLAHELGHITMHQSTEHRPGTKTVESQAHRFAGALFAPAEALISEIPDTLHWPTYLELKHRWGLSMAALVHRAKDLGFIDDHTYIRAMKQRSSYGWRRVEPGHDARPLPKPSLLSRASDAAGLSREQVAEQAGIPVSVVNRILGEGPRPIVEI